MWRQTLASAPVWILGVAIVGLAIWQPHPVAGEPPSGKAMALHVADVDHAERGDRDEHPDRRGDRERAALARARPASAGGKSMLGATAG